MVWAAQYSAVGGVKRLLVNEVNNSIRLQGQYEDEETRLCYNRFRYFEPRTGQFASQDPLRFIAGSNHYSFLPNSQSWFDPLGLSCERIVPGNGKLQELAAQIREAGRHPATRNQRVIAVGMDSEGRLFAGSSTGFDRGQREMADAIGIARVPSRAGRHAEENLLDAVVSVKGIGRSNCVFQER